MHPVRKQKRDAHAIIVTPQHTMSLKCTKHGLLVLEKLPAKAGDMKEVSSVPGLGRPPGEGNDDPLQCSCLENPRDRGACWATSIGSQRVGHD